MAGKSARRARRMGLEEQDPDQVEALDRSADEPEVVERPRRGQLPATRSLPARFVAWVNQQGREGSSLHMQGRDAMGAYLVSVVLVVIPLVFIVANATTHTGTVLPSPIFQALGLILGLLTAASVKLENRVLTPLAAVISVLLTGTQPSAIPHNLQWLSEVDLVAGMGLVIVLTMRQSRARGVERAGERAARQAARSGRDARGGRTGAPRGSRTGGKRGGKQPEPTGPAPNRRYTPPKGRSA
jgi:uncharacterized integral membrane protein